MTWWLLHFLLPFSVSLAGNMLVYALAYEKGRARGVVQATDTQKQMAVRELEEALADHRIHITEPLAEVRGSGPLLPPKS